MLRKSLLLLTIGMSSAALFVFTDGSYAAAEKEEASNSVLVENKKNNLFDKFVNKLSFSSEENELILELNQEVTGYESLILREDSPSGNGVGVVGDDRNRMFIDYSELRNGHKYYLEYTFPNEGIKEVEEVTNSEFVDYINKKSFLDLHSITSDDQFIIGKTNPNTKVIVEILSDDDYNYPTESDENGEFSVSVPKTLPGRRVFVKSYGVYDESLANAYVTKGVEEVSNWFYNPTFLNNGKGWNMYGSATTITPEEDFTNFISTTSNGKIGANQLVEGKYGTYYTVSMDIKVNKFKEGVEGEHRNIYLGNVLPGGAINPGFSSRIDITDAKDQWKTVKFASPFYGNGTSLELGFTIWGVDNVDIRNVYYDRFDR
ncbi:hypothetical protein DOK67_0001680 [Enterococcus sp. DIV0212c]|uniref:hypothetical protein n=1 Tax=Enterococcus sp. DIV0212c TaxID=2230867 RepID=UPI001A9BFD87|nr:hypothetical protein [Enterococcus sp. DIV0212c]MBO1354812.1 hypothetical protein [Enterococcus sp. DIV0212c]